MEKHFGNDGLTFSHSLKTDKEQEQIMLKMPRDVKFTNTIARFDKQGICEYKAMTELTEYEYPSKTRAVLELAAESVRLLGSFFGH